jgi:hypothetical protein
MAKRAPNRGATRKAAETPEEFADLARVLGQLLPANTPLQNVTVLQRLRILTAEALDAQMGAARQAGYSWGQVGGAAGMSPQGAQKRVGADAINSG